MTERELLQGGTAHHSRHERDVVSEGSRGGYPPDPDAILRYPGNVLVGLSDNRVRIDESESEEGVEANESVSARTRASKTKTDLHTAKGEQSRQPSRRFRLDAVDASSAADATIGAQCGAASSSKRQSDHVDNDDEYNTDDMDVEDMDDEVMSNREITDSDDNVNAEKECNERWTICDSEVSLKCPQKKAAQTTDEGHILLDSPPPSSVIERELERCRAEIERLSCKLTKGTKDQLLQQINDKRKCELQVSDPSQVKQGHSLTRGRSSLPRSLQQKRIIRGKASVDGRQLAKSGGTTDFAKKSVVRSRNVMQFNCRDDNANGQCMKDCDTLVLGPKQLSDNRVVRDRRNVEFCRQRRSRRDQNMTTDSEVDGSDFSSKSRECKDRRISKENVYPYEGHFSDYSDRCEHRYDDSELKRHVKRSYKADRCSYARADESNSPIPSRKRSLGYMKPEKFNGSSCFETFLVQFQNCAQFNHWNDKEKLHYLRWSLTGDAAQMLWGTENMTYKQLLDRLRSRFGSYDMETKYQTEIQCRRRKPDESLRELAQDIRRLMMLAYPGERSKMAERLAKEYFIVALDDPELEFKVREKEPQTLDSALKTAQRLEMFKNAVRHRVNARQRFSRQVAELPDIESNDLEDRVVRIEQSMQQSQQRIDKSQTHEQQHSSKQMRSKNKKKFDNQQICAAAETSDETWKDSLLLKVRELEAAQRVTDAKNDALNKEVGRLRHLEQLRSVPSQAAHTPVTRENVVRSQANVKKCFNCNQTGHFFRSCPYPRRQNNENEQSNVQNNSTLQVNVATSSSKLGRHSYLRMTVGSCVHDCLLDTGSDVCLIPEHLVVPANIQRTSRTLKAANGSSIPTLGEVTLPLSIGRFTTQVTGLVSCHVSETILGIDFLVENKAIWDFDSSTIRLGNEVLHLHSRCDKNKWCRRVVLQEDVVVPARSEINLPTQVQFRRFPISTEKGHWGTEPSQIKAGLHVSRTLIPSETFTDIPIRVMNVMKESVTLKSGTAVANLQPFEVVDEFVEEEHKVTQVKQLEEEDDDVPEFIQRLLAGVDDSIPESACLALQTILRDHADVFSHDENDLGRTDVVMHYVDTGDARPVRQPLRRYPPAHVEAISQHVDNMLKQGTIEPASSPWASNVVLVRKKDGSLRCCIDYRQLNAVTRRDAYPLPRIDSCLDAMANATLFSTFDLRSSYHQVLVAPQDRDKTTFICPRGMYRYRTMPFGLCNAGATFQRLMDVVMSGLHLEVCLIYLDDIILFSRTIEEHLERLLRVLGRLRTAGLKLKPEKCSLMQKSVTFLGHVVSGAGISTDPEKTRAVAQWPVPTSVKETKSFLGLASYYRRFIGNFAGIAAPLHALTKKDQAFIWSNEAHTAFLTLRNALISAPVLAMPNDTDEYILDTDAGNHSIGAVLSQIQDGTERVIAYASRSLDKREMNYCITRKELLAIVYSLKYFKQYLMGRHFKIRTDHAPLTWLRRTPDPIGQQARWLEQMEEYSFVVEHRPGVRHSNADALSRLPCRSSTCVCRQNSEHPKGEKVAVMNVTETDSLVTSTNQNLVVDGEELSERWSLANLKEVQENDPDCSCIIRLLRDSPEKPSWDSVSLQSHDVHVLWSFWPRLRLHNGLLERKYESTDGLSVHWQVIIPVRLRDEFLSVVHGGMSGGHLARRRTAAAIQSRAYWPRWSSDLDAFLCRCEPCVRYHRGKAPRRGTMQTPMVGEPWIRVSVDITGPHPRSSRFNQYILTVVDHFSKFAFAIPLRCHTAPVVARALMIHVFAYFGAPLQILTDRGPEFESGLFQELLRWMEIEKIRTTVFRPSTNGVVERFHRTLNSMLAKSINDSQKNWDDRVYLVLAAYRASVHESTGFTPNRLFLGREVRLPVAFSYGVTSR